MKNKYKILITSMLISMSLVNAESISAEESTSPENIETVESYDQTSEVMEVLDDIDFLNVEQMDMLNQLINKKEFDTNLFLEALSLHSESEFNLAVSVYEELINNSELSAEEVKLLQVFIEEATEEVNILNNEKSLLTAKEDKVVEDAEQDENKETEQSKTFSLKSTSNSNVKALRLSSAEMYEEVMTSKFATESWEKALDYKSEYGRTASKHERVREAINHAAQNILNMGIRRHEKGLYDNAIGYYNRILGEELVDTSIKNSAAFYKNQAQNSTYLSADDLYNRIMNARYATQAWEEAQIFKKYFEGKDSRVKEAVNQAATYILNMGIRRHRDSLYEEAISYYDFIISEDLINASTKKLTQNYRIQAAEGTYITADELYQEVMNAQYASDSWKDALTFKRYFNGIDSRVEEVVNQAANNILKQGIKRYEDRKYTEALDYFEDIISEDLVSPSLKFQAEDYQIKIQKNMDSIQSKKMYEGIINSPFATESWEKALAYKDAFGDVQSEQGKVKEAVNHAAHNILNMGIRRHEKDLYENAIGYYNRILNEELTDASIKKLAAFYKNQAQNATYLSAEDLYNSIMNAQYASQAWDEAQTFKQYFEGRDSRVEEAVNQAATYVLNMGIRRHEGGLFVDAISYYEQILSEGLVNNSLKNQAQFYLEQAKNNDFVSADEIYSKVMNGNIALETWENAQLFKQYFEKMDTRVQEAINHAGQNLFNMAVKSHRQGNFSKATDYYSKLLNEPLLNLDFKNHLNQYLGLANKKVKLKSASEYYRDINNISTATGRWKTTLEALSLYPENTQLQELLDEVALNNLNLGRKNQRNSSTASASTYYLRVLNEERVSESVRTLATVFLNQLNPNHKPVVYIDVGHGGYDPGASHFGVNEKTLNLNVSRYLANELESRGYVVIMSRETDVFLELIDRAVEANQINSDIFISVHHNSMGGSGIATGIETFIHHRVASGFGQETNHSNFELDDTRISESLYLANHIHSNLISDLPMFDRGVKGNNYSVLRNTDIPAVLLELGFMDNRNELNKINNSSYQKQAANAIANGIDNYFKEVK